MTHQEKISALLAANKAQYHTFRERAYNARIICSADAETLPLLADALGVTFTAQAA